MYLLILLLSLLTLWPFVATRLFSVLSSKFAGRDLLVMLRSGIVRGLLFGAGGWGWGYSSPYGSWMGFGSWHPLSAGRVPAVP